MDKTTPNARLVTTGLNCVFYYRKSVDCKDQICGKVLIWLPMKWAAWFCCLLDLSSGVMSRASFATFFTDSEIFRIYVVRSFKLVAEILYCNFFLFYMQLLSSRPIAQNVKYYLKKHALELFQYSYSLFDNRFELNSDVKAIVEMTRPNISAEP